MSRVSLLPGGSRMVAQVAAELTKHGHTVLMVDHHTPAHDLMETYRPAATAMPVETFKGKRVAQWKRERSR